MERTRKLSPRQIAEKNDVNEEFKVVAAQAVEAEGFLAQIGTSDMFTVVLESTDTFIEFNKVDRYRASTIKHELIQFCQNLGIIENIVTVTKEEKE